MNNVTKINKCWMCKNMFIDEQDRGAANYNLEMCDRCERLLETIPDDCAFSIDGQGTDQVEIHMLDMSVIPQKG